MTRSFALIDGNSFYCSCERVFDPRLKGKPVIVAGRLWRSTNRALPKAERQSLVDQLMDARRSVKDAKAGKGELKSARAAVDEAKVGLGERGPVWRDDGAPDYNRHLAKNTPYAECAAALKP